MPCLAGFKLKFIPCIYYQGAHSWIHSQQTRWQICEQRAAAFEFEAILHVFDFHWLLFFVCSCCSCFSPSQVAPGQPQTQKKRSHGLVLPSGSLAASRVNGCARANFFLRELKVARWEEGPFSLLPTCLPAFLRATFITWFQLQLLLPKGAREYECVWVWVLSRHFYLRWWP